MLLILDEKPRNPLQRIRVETKVFVQEGLRHWNWRQVFGQARVGGGRTRPQDLIRELRRRKLAFVHNDFSSRRYYDYAWVVKDPLALRWAIEQKRKGYIKTLIAGPMIVNLPHEMGGIIHSPEIDAVVFASPWIRDLFNDLSSQKIENTFVWPAGVDERDWSPGLGKKDLTLVVDKQSGILDPVVSKLLQKNYQVEVLRHGNFSRRQYRDALRKARFAVLLSPWETQGTSMFEAWSCDVPTLHWNPGEMKYFGKNYGPATSCFYLTDKCGVDFFDLEDFTTGLDKIEDQMKNFAPRNFVLEGFTLKHSVDRFLHVLRESERSRRESESLGDIDSSALGLGKRNLL